MENYYEPVLSEEQMAIYLDGMLSVEESGMIEEIISSNPIMGELQEAIDTVDSTYIYESDCEIPIECMADDFSLPVVEYGYDHSEEFYETEDNDVEAYGDVDDYQDEEYQDETADGESSFDSEYEEISF